jgi:hypothetical protein
MLGGREVMIQSPLYREIVEEAEREGETRARRRDILKIRTNRFGDEAGDLEIELEAVEHGRLEVLFDQAMNCSNLADFRERLLS